MTLADLPKSVFARITGFTTDDADLETRLREIGFAEGDMVEAMHFGLFGKNPISVRLNGAIIALRRFEAGAVAVEVHHG